MTGDRWRRVNEIFHGALEAAESDREGFVLLATAGDVELEAEVRELLEADGAADGYFEAAAVAETRLLAPFEAGDVLCGRFRIVRVVGEGGMGFVFEAHDLELGVTVALKAIHPAIAVQAGALARFQQEVRLARRITHPNVCRTFDIDREVETVNAARRETVFLTMEFLEGETLAARLKRRGRLGVDEALSISRQVASALGAAHALGIVHRDIKPANILLVPADTAGSSRAVVMDFGLARLDPVQGESGGASLSRGNQMVGTLAYMAPEQMDGEAVSPATDVYAFGLVLFEMVTGERAFPSQSLLSGIWQRMAGSTPSAKERVPGLPVGWERAIQGCLRRVPGERFQSAAAAVAVLDGGRTALPRRPMRAAYGWALTAGAILLAAMALFAGGPRLKRARGEPHVVAGTLVYLAPVKNETGEKPLDNLTELVREGLAQSVQMNLLDPVRAGDTLARMKQPETVALDPATAREVALRSGAGRVIYITLSGSAGDYHMETVIEQPDTTPRRARARWQRSTAWHFAGSLEHTRELPPELLAALRSGSEWIRATVGEAPEAIARLDAAPEDVTTGDWQALQDFDQAQRWLRTGHKEEAVTLLRDAVRRDPGFARAYATLADNLVSMGRGGEGYEAYLKALNDDAGERLSRKERDFIKASFAVDTRDFQAAVEAFRDYTAFYENDFYAWAYQAYPLEELDRPRDALRVLERADRLTPNHDAAGEMTYAYLLMGDQEGTRRAIQATRAGGHEEKALYLEGVAALCGGDYARAEQRFTQLHGSEKPGLAVLGRLAKTRLLAEQGRYEQALQGATTGEDELAGAAGPEDRAQQTLDRAWLEFRLSRGAGGLADVERAITLSQSPDTALNASTILGGALRALSLVDRRRARDLLSRMMSALPGDDVGVVFALARARLRGEMLLAEGDASAALAAFRAADRLDAPLAPREYLARALLGMAKREHDAQRADAFRREALAAYGRVALRPATVWMEAWRMPPGFVADQMTAYLEVSHTLRQADANQAQVAGRIASLRIGPGKHTAMPRTGMASND